MTDLEREEEILKKALEDYTAMLPYQHEIYRNVRRQIHSVPDSYKPYVFGLCHYLVCKLGYEQWEIDHLIQVYFEVSKTNSETLNLPGNISIRIKWINRALELIRHRKQVEEHKKLGNPKFKYSDDTYNRERVKEAIWKNNS